MGLSFKFTFVSTLLAAIIILFQLFRRSNVHINFVETIHIMGLAIGAPSIFVLKGLENHSSFRTVYSVKSEQANAISYRNVFFIKKDDLHLLAAPPYPYNYKFSNNQYSYPGLLHLAIFTDMLNIFQYDPLDLYDGSRNTTNQNLMELSVKTSLPIGLCCAISVLFCLGTVIKGLYKPTHSRQDVEVITILGLAWFTNIAVFLPFIPTAYTAGYWTPRLIFPAIISFLLLLFFCLDQITSAYKSKKIPGLILGYVCLQSIIHILFLWPVGLMKGIISY